MQRLSGLRVLVAGGGAIGATAALTLAREGASVTLAEPAAQGANASGVAAGMLAPAFEAVFDSAAHLELMIQARDLWPELAASIGLGLQRSGAMAVGGADEVAGWFERLRGVGIEAQHLSAVDARARFAGLREGLTGVLTDQDWRLEPAAALAALRAAGARADVTLVRAAVTGFEGGVARLDDGGRLYAEALVIATGASISLAALAPELAALTPVKGHILRAPGLVLEGPVLRYAGGYICPSPGGVIVGATMEPGLADTAVEPDVAAALQRRAGEIAPAIGAAAMTAAAGVRAATPDGLPLIGASQTPGVWLAVGARRNGWLLAPLAALTLAAALAGHAPPAALAAGRPVSPSPG